MSVIHDPQVAVGVVVPGRPHPLLIPDACEAYRRLRDGYEAARDAIARSGADTILVYSTGWRSILGHQMQAHPNPVWDHVDPEWHALGTIPYSLRMDPELAQAYVDTARARGLHARTVAYDGFPMDTGTVVALQLLNPGNRLPATVVSCNMYADRAETLVLGKAARDALARAGRRAAVVAVTGLSDRLFAVPVAPEEDRISSPQDDEWNRKLLEFLGQGRLEDVSQLAREFARQAHGDSKLKAIWWLAAVMGQHNRYSGDVLAYGPIHGSGAAVVTLSPAAHAAADKEFDEADVEVYGGDRGVLSTGTGAPSPAPPHAGSLAASPPASPDGPRAKAAAAPEPPPATDARRVDVAATKAPKPVGAYPHARRVGDLLYLSGVGPRQPETDAIPGGPIRDADGGALDYDAAAQTDAVIRNVKAILEASGSSLDRVVDVTSFLVDMDRDFADYNRVYAEWFRDIGPTRTTLAIRALPTPIAVEMKVIALAGDVDEG